MSWSTVTLESVCLKITDGSHNPPKGVRSSEYLMLSSQNIFHNHINLENPRYLTKQDFEQENKRTDVSTNDVLLTIVGTVGRVAVVTPDLPKLTLQRSVGVLKPNTEYISPRFLMYSLQRISDKLTAESRGVAQKGIYLKQIRELKIPLPTLAEQLKIAAILDAADSLRQKDQQLVERYTALSQSLFLEMFGGKADLKVALSSLCVVNPKKSEIAAISRSVEVSFVPMAKVSEEGEVDLSESRTIDEVWTGFTYFADEDVVFAKITPCMENGKGGIMRNLKNKIGFGTTEFHVLRPIKHITTAEWLFYLTKQKTFREAAEKNMTGSAGQKRVPTNFFDTYMVSKPSYEKQLEFAQRIQLIEAQKQQAQRSLEKSEALFNSLLQRAFTGELTAKMAA